MKFVDTPNLPGGPVDWVIADGRISEKMEKGLLQLGIRAIKTIRLPTVYEAVAYHPDIMLHHLGGNRIIHAPGVGCRLLDELKCMGFYLIKGETLLSPNYPGDIAYNVARVGSFAFHNLRHTDPVLRDELERLGVELVNVKQGYAKCSVSIVDKHAIITSDAGIARAAEKNGVEALLIESENNILLPGLNYGFIGGSSGLADSHIWMLSGNVRKLKSFSKIIQFLKNRNIGITSLTDEDVVDIGSIIPILTK